MQRKLLEDALKDQTPPRERAQVARAWAELEERKRVLRMKPKPRDVDVLELKREKMRKLPAFPFKEADLNEADPNDSPS